MKAQSARHTSKKSAAKMSLPKPEPNPFNERYKGMGFLIRFLQPHLKSGQHSHAHQTFSLIVL
jgi:hypothetical protein